MLDVYLCVCFVCACLFSGYVCTFDVCSMCMCVHVCLVYMYVGFGVYLVCAYVCV